VDDAEANRKFAESMGVKYPILSDPEKKVATAYGVLASNGQFAQRWTYIIDDQGMVRAIDTSVKVGSHGADLVRMLRELGAPMK
jgi:peroxiredoxin Q/BCP